MVVMHLFSHVLYTNEDGDIDPHNDVLAEKVEIC